MRLIFSVFLVLIVVLTAAEAAIPAKRTFPAAAKEKPPVEASKDKEAKAPISDDPYTVSNIDVDVTADNAAQARDKALMQAQRTAYARLCERLGSINNVEKLSDDEMAFLVQSFEVQSERLSSVRYIGVFTIRFNQASVQKRLNLPTAGIEPTKTVEQSSNAASAAVGTYRLAVLVRADTSAAWAQIRRRLGFVPNVSNLDTLGVGRGQIQVDLSYSGTMDELRDALLAQNLILRQGPDGAFEVLDGTVVVR